MEELTFYQKLQLYESAEDNLHFMQAHYSSIIWEEKRKTNPDYEKIAQWETESRICRLEDDALNHDNVDYSRKIIDKYNLKVIEIYKK